MSDEKRSAGANRLHERATEEIRVLLARRKMSAAELARRTGQKPAALSRRMTGDVAFDLDDLEVIARELGVSVVDLLGGGPQTTVASLTLPERSTSDQPKVRLPAAPMIPGARRPARIETFTSPAEYAA